MTYRVAVANPLDNGTVIGNTATVHDGVTPPFEMVPVTTTVTTGSRSPASSQRVYLPVVVKGAFPSW